MHFPNERNVDSVALEELARARGGDQPEAEVGEIVRDLHDMLPLVVVIDGDERGAA